MTMKTILLTALLLLLPCSARCQEVFNMVLENATRTVNSPTTGFTQAQIAQFKRTALLYIKRKAFERTDSVPSAFLNTQAYFLSEYLTLFFNEILKDKKTADGMRKAKIMLFMNASVATPLFKDEDKETTMAFTGDDSITPFCLDTNWQNAYLSASENLKAFK